MAILLQEKTLEMSKYQTQALVPETTKAATELGKESVELPPIVVRPQTELPTQQTTGYPVGRILALNKDNNFVIIDLGQDAGVKVGDVFGVYREDSSIASIEVIQTRKSISACDIKRETTPVKVGDTVR